MKILYACLFPILLSGCATLGVAPQSSQTFIGEKNNVSCAANVEKYNYKNVLRLSCANAGTIPVKTNQVYDVLQVVSAGETVHEIDLLNIESPDRLTPPYYNSGIINPGTSLTVAQIQIKDPSINHLIKNDQVKSIIWTSKLNDKKIFLFPESEIINS